MLARIDGMAAEAQRLRARRSRGCAEVRQSRGPRACAPARRRARCMACRLRTRTCTTRKGKLAECGSKIRKGWIAPDDRDGGRAAGSRRLVPSRRAATWSSSPTGRPGTTSTPARRATRGTWTASPAARRPAPAPRLRRGSYRAALGSDTGGSIRMPAHFCGVTGFKPTNGRVSRANAMPLSFTLDTVGPLAQTAEDCALILLDHRRSRSARSDDASARRTGTRRRRSAR